MNPAGTTDTFVGGSVDVDVLIVGSGPVGAAWARTLKDGQPALTVLMVERGPALTPRPGTNLKNLLGKSSRPAGGIPVVAAESLARSGTTLLDPSGPRPGHMPAAAVSTNVGGMGAHWSCATPDPGDDERIGLVPSQEWAGLLTASAALLNSSTRAFGASARGAAMIEVLGREFAGSTGRPVQVMPHACAPASGGELSWTGADTVLGPLADGASGFTLLADTLCRRLTIRAGTVTGAELVHLPTGQPATVRARAVVVAADSLRTPQLLWGSGIRPAALGHYLNEHPMVGATVVLSDATMDRAGELDPAAAATEFETDPLAAVWIPYAGRTHRFSGQINSSPGSPAGFAVAGLESVPPSRIVSLTWFCPKQLRFEDRIEFGDELDEHGMPVPEIHYSLSDEDHRVVARAVQLTAAAGTAMGQFVAGEEPALLTDGQSLHYMGTVRAGAVDDGTSVCDGHGRVWSVRGLYVGGNGLIPTATACNPTLTSVALAVRGARQLAAELR